MIPYVHEHLLEFDDEWVGQLPVIQDFPLHVNVDLRPAWTRCIRGDSLRSTVGPRRGGGGCKGKEGGIGLWLDCTIHLPLGPSP